MYIHRYIGTGLPDFSWSSIPKLVKIYQRPHNIPNLQKEHQMAIKYTKILTPRPSKMKQNSDFRYENIPSGNPA
jgi:hypothetical protein